METTETDVLDASAPPRGLMPRLSVICPPNPELVGVGQTLVAGTHAVVGRAGTFLPGVFDVKRVSRQHAELRSRKEGLTVVDLGSRNGTRVNGELVEEARLADGDFLALGPVILLAHMAPIVYPEPNHPTLWGGSWALAQLLDKLAIVALEEHHVALVGETGVGKELVARAIHERSGRRGRFVAVNCAALQDGVLASELFGYEKGAFSGADTARRGLVEAAAGGTLFLDEIAASSPTLQGTLLRLLDDKEFRPVGSQRARRADVRFVSAMQSGDPQEDQLRSDLIFRLSRRRLEVPALRDRPEDIAYLAQRFAADVHGAAVALGRNLAMDLVSRRWPGNVRQLRAVVEELALTHPPVDGALEAPPGTLPAESPEARMATELPPQKKRTKRPSRAELEATLREHQGRIAEVARHYGVYRKSLYRWLDTYAIDVEAFRAESE